MPVLSYASLEDVRRCIKQRRRIRFIYRKEEIIAEPYLFGNFRKTRAFVLCAWKIHPRPRSSPRTRENRRRECGAFPPRRPKRFSTR